MRLILLSLVLVACSSGAEGGDPEEESTGDEVVAVDVPAVDVPERLTQAELDALIDEGVLQEAELGEAVSRTEMMPGDGGNRVEGDSVFVSGLAPLGHSTTVYMDGDGRLWFVVRSDHSSVPEGVSVPATRIYDSEYSRPAGTDFGGVVQLSQ